MDTTVLRSADADLMLAHNVSRSFVGMLASVSQWGNKRRQEP